MSSNHRRRSSCAIISLAIWTTGCAEPRSDYIALQLGARWEYAAEVRVGATLLKIKPRSGKAPQIDTATPGLPRNGQLPLEGEFSAQRALEMFERFFKLPQTHVDVPDVSEGPALAATVTRFSIDLQ